ncbi:MAG: restriction endonuclease subunit S, partial [Crenarchaeota archaeon]|nr:restriction endonuclease subunit S [Thermoproteota archaeon]
MEKNLIPIQIYQVINKINKNISLVPLKHLGEFRKGKGISNNDILSEGNPCITYGQLYTNYNGLINEIKTYISDETASQSTIAYPKEILFPGSGETIEEIGKASVILVDKPIYIGGDVIAFKSNKEIDSLFLSYVLNSDIFKVQSRRFGQGHSVVHIYSKDLEKILIPNFPISEQKRIADILSTWDRGIELKEKTLEELKRFYNSVSKTLFTAEKGVLTKTTLGKISKIEKGKQLSKIDMISNAKYPVINGGIGPSGYTDDYNTMEKTITISEGGNSCGYVSLVNEKFWAGGHCYKLKIKDNNIIDKKYIYHQLKFRQRRIMRLRVGSGLPNIQKSEISKFMIYLHDYEEQRRIS